MNSKEFLKEHAVYQIYPISFCDSNGDGKGDLKGIISKLDYLKDLGIRILWLSPIYKSPMFDMGYDISDYKSINPIFGTMEDFDTLLEEVNKRDMKLVMDLVVNHTSDQHPWFQKALKDPNSKYRDYYVFRKGRKDKKGNYTYPNNWTSNFTGPAWEKVPNEEGMYYLHIFSKQQPDLNWHNPAVLKEVEDIMAFWMDKGVYGFRCDVISEIYKESYEDGKKTSPFAPIGVEHYVATQGNHEILQKIQADVVRPRGGILIGECGGPITTEDGKKYEENGELDTFFEFDIANLNPSLLSMKIKPELFKNAIVHWQKEVDWNGNYLENHDQHRVFNRYVYGKDELMGAKMLLTLQFTLRGTPFIYQGQEFASHDYPKPLKINQCTDCVTKATYQIAKGYHIPSPIALKMAHRYGREDERAPMAFTNKEPDFGFSTNPNATPWQPYNLLSKQYNAEDAFKDPNSVLHYFKKVNALRENNRVFTNGSISFLDSQKDVLVYRRDDKLSKALVVLNLSNKKRALPSSVLSITNKKLLLRNYKDESDKLRPYEALVYLL